MIRLKKDSQKTVNPMNYDETLLVRAIIALVHLATNKTSHETAIKTISEIWRVFLVIIFITSIHSECNFVTCYIFLQAFCI